MCPEIKLTVTFFFYYKGEVADISFEVYFDKQVLYINLPLLFYAERVHL